MDEQNDERISELGENDYSSDDEWYYHYLEYHGEEDLEEMESLLSDDFVKKGFSVDENGIVLNGRGEKTIFTFPLDKTSIIDSDSSCNNNVISTKTWNKLENNVRQFEKASNVNCVERDERDERDEHLKKPRAERPEHKSTTNIRTRWCANMIATGKCYNKKCSFAHNESEYVFSTCHNGNYCRKKTCMFKHDNETVDEFKIRTKFTVPIFKKVKK